MASYPRTVAEAAFAAFVLVWAGCLTKLPKSHNTNARDAGTDAASDGALDGTSGPDSSVDAGFCGNGNIEGNEVCDGTDLGLANCASLERGDGLLGCLSDCTGFDVSACGPLIYGNGSGGDVIVSGAVNLDQDTLASGRSCADGGEAVAYSVVTLQADRAVVDGPVSGGCVEPGDQVLLINLQGRNTTQIDNVGNWEILEVAQVNASTVIFTIPKQRFYGDAGGDANIGTTAGTHRVMLQRVPQYQNLTVQAGGRLTVTAFGCVRGIGGVLPAKVNGQFTLEDNGLVDVSGAGFIGGGPVRDEAGAQGDSYGGDCDPTDGHTNAANLGGGGGGSYSGDTRSHGGGGGGGYGTAGNPGESHSGVQGGAGGAIYGDPALSRIFFGSGGGSGGGDASYDSGEGGSGGGIVVFFVRNAQLAGSILVEGSNGVSSHPSSISGSGGGGAGGTIFFRAVSEQATPSFDWSVAGGLRGTANLFGGDGGSGRAPSHW